MHCPMQNGENAEVLLDYCARKLPPTVASEVDRHVQSCGGSEACTVPLKAMCGRPWTIGNRRQ